MIKHLLCILFVCLASTAIAVIDAEWRYVLVNDETTRATYPQISFGGQHPHSIDMSLSDPNYGAVCIDVGGVRTFQWLNNKIRITYPRCYGLLAPFGQSIKIHPTNRQIMLYAGDNSEWSWREGAIGGVYRTTDFGDTWTRVSTVQPNFAIQGYPLSSTTVSDYDTPWSCKMRGNHDNFAFDPTNANTVYWAKNQLYKIKITVDSLDTVPDSSTWERYYGTAAGDAYDIITGDTSTAWLRVTSADAVANTIEGFVNFGEYYTNAHPFQVGETITSVKVGGAASVMSPAHPTITAVEVHEDSSWLYKSTDAGVTWAAVTAAIDTDHWFYHSKGIKLNSDGTILYYYGAAGLYAYNIAGETLAAVGDLPVQDVCDFSIDPVDGTKMVAAVLSGGFYKSTNTGTNWTKDNGMLTSYAWSIAIAPTGSADMVALQESNVANSQKYTADGGTTWSNATIAQAESPFNTILPRTGIQEGVHGAGQPMYRTCAVKYHPEDKTKLYAYGNATVWYSVDSGHTWHIAEHFLGEAAYQDRGYGFAGGDPNAWGLGIADYWTVLMTYDNGTSFKLQGYDEYHDNWYQNKTVTLTPQIAASKYSIGICYHPTDSQKAIATFGSTGQGKLAKTADGGETWTMMDNDQPTAKNFFLHWCEADPNFVYLGTCYSDDGGTTLKYVNTTGITQFYGTEYTAFAAGSDSTHIQMAATETAADNYYIGTLIYLSGGTGSGQTRQITDYVGSTKIATISAAWDTIPDDTTKYKMCARYALYAVDKTDDRIVYALNQGSTRYIAKSADKGQTWSLLYDLESAMGYTDGATIIPFDIYNDDILYTSIFNPANAKSYARDLIWTTSQQAAGPDHGGWTITAAVNDLDGDYDAYGNRVDSVKIDPRNSSVVYVMLGTVGLNRIWRSVNAGVDWTNISGNLPMTARNGLQIKPDTGELIVGGQGGTWVYPSYDATESDDCPLWAKWGAGAGGGDPPIPANHAPVAANVSRTVIDKTANCQLYVPASDLDDDPITWSFVSGNPKWASINPDTGVITGIPRIPGVWTITVQASDGTATDTCTVVIESTEFSGGTPLHYGAY